MTKQKAAKELETALGCGPYQIFVFLIYQFVVFIQSANMVFMSFGKVAPNKWTCHTGDNITDFGNVTLNETEQCQLFVNGSCENIYSESDFHSIVTEWHLLCNRKYIVYLTMSTQMMGVAIGSPIWGQLSDSFGRKWTLLVANIFLVSLDVFSIFSPNWEAYLVFRFLIGFSCGGTICISWVLMTEMLKAKHRLWVVTVAGWPLGFAVFAGLAYATQDWKKLSLVIAALGLPPLVMIPLIPESPRWLLQKQKLDQAQRSLQRVMWWNREKESKKSRVTHIIGAFQEASHPLRSSNHSRGRKYTFWHLCQTRKLAMNTMVLILTYLAISMITYGIILNNDKLLGDKYLNFMLFACIRWISSILTPVFDSGIKSCGRKLTSTISFALISLASIIIALILIFASPNDSIAGHTVTGLMLFASALTSPVWTSLNLMSVEAFPTPIRNIAVGVGALFTRLGGVIVPVFLYMAELWRPSPFVLFASAAFLSALICGFLMPETKNKAMPDVMPQPESRWWCCFCSDQSENGHRPSGTTRSNSFTIYQFSETNNHLR